MKRIEDQYLDLLQTVMSAGADKGDRTGTGTRSIFGGQMRCDLGQEFPLLTTKRVFWKGVVEEMLWFLSGSTNVNDLPNGVKPWWTHWATPEGDLGPIYGEQYRRSRWFFETEPKLFEPHIVERTEGLFCGVGDIGSTARERRQSEARLLLKNVWRDMLKRCYDEGSASYPSYGAKGIHVASEWLSYDQFERDATKLIGWDRKQTFPSRYSLDKDIRAASNRYSAETCMWASRREQSLNTSQATPFYATSPAGVEMLFPSIGDMALEYGCNISAIHRCLEGKLRTHHGWSNFRRAYGSSGRLMRFRELDQIEAISASIRHNPSSRRHVLNLWHSPAMDHAQLPCCHGSVIQFYVHDGRLSSHVYQRSADLFIGVPINLASYGLLTCLMAAANGLRLGDMIWSFGDAHVYRNHFEQVQTQLGRAPLLQRPTVTVDPTLTSIFDFTAEHIALADYEPYPAIPAPVAV